LILREQLRVVLGVEGREAAEEDVEDDAHGPEVHLVGVLLALEDRRHVARRAARRGHLVRSSAAWPGQNRRS
jgi:hypothetical protein